MSNNSPPPGDVASPPEIGGEIAAGNGGVSPQKTQTGGREGGEGGDNAGSPPAHSVWRVYVYSVLLKAIVSSWLELTAVPPTTLRASKRMRKVGASDRLPDGTLSPAPRPGAGVRRSNCSSVNCSVSSSASRSELRTKRPMPPIVRLFSRGTSIQPPGLMIALTGTLNAGPNCCGMVAGGAAALLTQ